MARNKKDKTDRPSVATSATNAPKRFNRGKDGTFPLDKSFRPNPKGVVEELGGDGLQTLRVTWSNASPLMAEGDFWRDLETILDNCDEIMRRHGWDRKAGNGRNFPSDRTSEPFSELWYAGKIGFECWNLLHWHRKRGPNEIALSQALYLGRLLTGAEWDGLKPSTMTGIKHRKVLKECRETAARTARQKKKKLRDAIASMLNDTDLAGGARENYLEKRLIKEGMACSPRTIRRYLADLKKVGHTG